MTIKSFATGPWYLLWHAAVHGNTLQARVLDGLTQRRKSPTIMRTTLVLLLTLASFAPDSSAYAQILRPAVGIGLSPVGTTGQSPVGLGVDARLSWPINADFSVTAGTSLVGFVFRGRDDAAYFLMPQASGIVKLDATNLRAPYVIAGFGAYFPIGNTDREDESGPVVQVGIGWITTLQATAVYLEISPTLVVAQSAANLLLPVRFGVIL